VCVAAHTAAVGPVRFGVVSGAEATTARGALAERSTLTCHGTVALRLPADSSADHKSTRPMESSAI